MPYATRDGVRLFYSDTGSGDPPLLFVHGWCCDSTHWRKTIPAFRRKHRIVNVDLRGHGRSDKPDQDYTMDGFAEDLALLAGRLGLRKPIVLGHSMGALIGLTLARRRRRTLAGLVMVDGALHISWSQAVIDGVLQGLGSPAYRNVAKAMIDGMFRPASPQSLRVAVTERMLRTPQHVLAPALRSLVAQMRPAPQELAIPALYIAAGRTLDDLKLIEESVPGIQIGRTVGAGHFNMLETPDQVNAMLRTFIEQLPPVGAGLQTRAGKTK